MSNYPNMSYCMYENTVAALNQIYEDLMEESSDGTSIEKYRKGRSSRQEAEAFDNLIHFCHDIIEAYKEMEENDDEE